MRVRKIDPTTGRVFGGGQSSLYINNAEGVAQLVSTRLGLWVGDWFLALGDGTPYATRILGKYTEATRDLAIKARILGTTGVTEIVSYSMSLDRFSRKLTGSVTISTAYGQAVVQGPF